MIEKRTMGYVDFAYPNYDAKTVTVIIEVETGNVELYRPDEDDNSWYTPNETDHFYPTVEDAANALDKHKHELFDKMKEVKQYIEVMSEWRGCEAEGSPLFFKEEDYLPYQYLGINGNTSYYENRYNEVNKENDYLYGIIRTGFINIKGDSFKTDDVIHIKWGQYKAEIILTDGRRIETGNKVEFTIIKNLYGKNISEYTYPRLNDKPDEE
jgi:hypothetical protein